MGLAQRREDTGRPNPPMRIAEALNAGYNGPGMGERLEKRFGLGSNEGVRRVFFQHLEQLYDDATDPELFLACVDSVVANSVGKTDPGRYFCAVVMKRLQERALIPPIAAADW